MHIYTCIEIPANTHEYIHTVCKFLEIMIKKRFGNVSHMNKPMRRLTLNIYVHSLKYIYFLYVFKYVIYKSYLGGIYDS